MDNPESAICILAGTFFIPLSVTEYILRLLYSKGLDSLTAPFLLLHFNDEGCKNYIMLLKNVILIIFIYFSIFVLKIKL